MIKYVVPISGLKQSTNKIYAGLHWAQRKKFKDSILNQVVVFCRPVQKVKSFPVEISYQFIFSSRALDTLNCAYMAKCIEDAFRAIEIIPDDSPQYVARTVLEVYPVKKADKRTPAMAGTMGKAKCTQNEDCVIITINQINQCQNLKKEIGQNSVPAPTAK